MAGDEVITPSKKSGCPVAVSKVMAPPFIRKKSITNTVFTRFFFLDELIFKQSLSNSGVTVDV